ncbi:MAG: hypothetical protein ACHQJ6_07470 [Candidatus Berkiellales bacterium]
MKYLSVFFLALILLPSFVLAKGYQPNQTILPEEFKIYYKEDLGVSSRNFKGATAKLVPTSNNYEGVPGCYIACYAKNPVEGVYSIGDVAYLMGQIRVQGIYHQSLCIPKGYENKDIRTAKEFKQQCAAEFPKQCKNNRCWVGAETANWF